MANNLYFKEGIKTSFDALASKDPHTFYWTTDTKELFLGDTRMNIKSGTDITIDSSGNVSVNNDSHTHSSFIKKGDNTITKTTDDTVAKWGAYNNSVHWYATAGQLTNQPSTYGYLLNIGTGTEVHQLWMAQNHGDLAHRGGNSSGWGGSWKTILDSSNYNSYAPTKTGGGASGNWGINITGNAATATTLSGLTSTIAELNYCDGVTSNIQTQLNNRANKSNCTVNNYLQINRSTTIANNNPAELRFRVTQTDNNVTSGANIKVYDDHDANTYGANMVICSGGNMVIGGGESPDSCYSTDLKNSTGENMYIVSDNAIYFYPNANTYANKKNIHINNAGQYCRDGYSSSWIGGRTTALIKSTSCSGYSPVISVKTTNGSWEMGSYNASNWHNDLVFTYCTDANYNAGTNTASGQVRMKPGGLVTGAVWNDYAEYRNTVEPNKPGYCVVENGDDTLHLSNRRLERGAMIISDTFGFAIGETAEAQTPVAVSGRVLAYTYEPREEYKNHIGDCVCAGPEGKVSIMSDEEARLYPASILGTISAVPEYETWGSGDVKVDGRVWIKVR